MRISREADQRNVSVYTHCGSSKALLVAVVVLSVLALTVWLHDLLG